MLERSPGLLPGAPTHVIALAERKSDMWFDENTQHTCEDCRYGNKEEENEHCGMCLLYQAHTGEAYSQWEKIVPWPLRLTGFMKESGIW